MIFYLLSKKNSFHFLLYFLLIKYFFISNVPIIIFERTMNPNNVPILYTPHVPSFLKVANRVPEFVPRTEANDEPCDYGYAGCYFY